MSELPIRRRAHESRAQFAAHVPALLRRIYAARGIAHQDELDLSLSGLLPVSSLDGVEAAAALVASHRAAGRVLIVGDFDADGATSAALLVRALRALQFHHVDYLVPDRFLFGYGLTVGVVEAAAQRGPTLIITVDNGISSLDGVRRARELGIPVLVTDHHLPGPELPDAAAILNPNLPASTFGSRALAGVGVAFYLAAALTRALGSRFQVARLLDLVALGTVADVATLDRNNRILVHQGLMRIRAGQCVPGIRALLEMGRRTPADAQAADLGFCVGPRINAAGRLTDMRVGIECLLADDDQRAMHCATQLSALNETRRDIESQMQERAEELITAHLSQLDSSDSVKGFCLYDADWHQGVVGLVASRIKERVHRPVIAFAPADGGELRGSARSIPGVHIRDALASVDAQHPGLLVKFGGHAMAAGATIAIDSLEKFGAAFRHEMAVRVDDALTARFIHSDGSLEPGELSLATARVLREAGPWGQGFPEPVFDGCFEVSDAEWLRERHLKLRLQGPSGSLIECICFSRGRGRERDRDGAIRAGAIVEIAYRLELNSFGGVQRLQLNASEVRLVPMPASRGGAQAVAAPVLASPN